MHPEAEFLESELERLFEIDEMKALAKDFLGIDELGVGDLPSKAAWARAIVRKLFEEGALEALVEAIVASQKALRPLPPPREEQALEVSGWRLIKRLGGGGLGQTYLAEKGNVRAALKILDFKHALERAAVRRWLVRQRLFARLEISGLAKVLDSGLLHDGRGWVATAFVDGQLLSARLGRTGPMHINEARVVLASVLRTLEALHARGLSHGNVKAENVFIVRSGGEVQALLVDGGADRLLSRNAWARGPKEFGVYCFAGTPKCVAPEQAMEGPASAASDLYAAGVLLYEMLTAKPLFQSDLPMRLWASHVLEEPPPPSALAPKGWVSRALDQIVLKALAKDPAARYQGAAAFREALEGLGRLSVLPEARKEFDEKAFQEARERLEKEPDHPEWALELERLAGDRPEQALLAFLEIAQKIEDKEAKKSLLLRAARLGAGEAKAIDRAIEAYRAILEIDPEEPKARAGLEEALREKGNFEELIDILVEKAEKESDSAKRASVLREIAHIYEHALRDEENAFVAWTQALIEAPEDEEVAKALEALARSKAERWNEAIASLSEAVQGQNDPKKRIALWIRLGQWYLRELKRPDLALSCFTQVLALDRHNPIALEEVASIYRASQSHLELIALLLQWAEALPKPKARDLRAEAGEIAYLKLSDTQRALELLEGVAREDPAHPKATEVLELIYTDRKDWLSLAKMFEAKAKAQSGKERAESLCALAEVYEDRLNQLDSAEGALREALEAYPQSLDALKALERIHSKQGRSDLLLEDLKAQLGLVATPRQRIVLWERIGALLEEELLDLPGAVQAFERVIEIEPGHESAYAALERLYRKLGRLEELVRTIEKHAISVGDEARKVELLLQAARVVVLDLGAPERALGFAERVLALRPDHPEALEWVARAKAKAGDRKAAVDALLRRAESESEKGKKTELFLRAAHMLEEAGDFEGAITHYKHALDLEESLEAMGALRVLYTREGDFHAASELLHREIALSSGAIQKAERYAELGRLRALYEKDKRGAREAYRKALELDPACIPALKGLGAMAFEDGELSEAMHCYESLIAHLDAMEREEALHVCFRLGEIAGRLAQPEKAQKAYFKAQALAPGERSVLERLAHSAFEAGLYAEASEFYRSLLERFEKEMGKSELAQIRLRLGESLRQINALDEAESFLKEALALGLQAQALRSLGALYRARGDHERAIESLRRLGELVQGEERHGVLVELGELYVQVGDKNRAIRSYQAALDMKGDDRNVLSKLMALYSETKDWSKLIEVILRIAELVKDPIQVAKYYNAAASIAHIELGRLDEAADYYEQALDLDPTLSKAFEGLVAALGQKQNWAQLERAYRNHLRRLEGKEGPELVPILDAFGELLHQRLGRIQEAIEIYEKAESLDPGQKKRAEILAELYTKEPKHRLEQAIQAHHKLLQSDPYRIQSLKALEGLYAMAERQDERFCICQALFTLRQAGPEQEAFFLKHRTRKPAAPKSPLNDELWSKHLLHPELDPLLTGLFDAIAPAVVALRSQPLSAFKLSPESKRDPEK
ncbi:MAG: tetratricopeptide repeat protein, partial [Sandaracinaceae bacterium]|nr:tetratricopeptide repeat protein [Sandaracinaceae bacterium]